MRAFCENPRFVLLAVLLIVIGGTAGLITRPQLEDPKANVRAGFITTSFSGASAAEVESLVTESIEQALREASGIRSIESASLNGTSVVYIRLTDEATDVDAVWTTIQDKLVDVTGRLPPGTGRPLLTHDRRWDSYTRVIALVDRQTSSAPSVLSRWAKDIENRLRFVPGTRFTELFGLPREEVAVEVDPGVLVDTGIQIKEVIDAIQVRDSNASDVNSSADSLSIPIRLDQEIDRLADLADVYLTGDKKGRRLRLADVSRIFRTEQMPQRTSAFIDGQRAVVIASRMDIDQNIDSWTRDFDHALQEIATQIPATLSLKSLFSQQVYTRQRSRDLYLELAAGMALVVVTTGLLMGWRSAIPICASMPLAILMTFFCMIPCGVSIHQMSIAGLIVALGVLDSNAIIAVDDLERRLVAGQSPTTAIGNSVRHLAMPLLCSNIITILGFAPAYFLPGPTGEFLGQLCWAVNVALAASVVLSLTIIPVLATWFLKPTPLNKPVVDSPIHNAYRTLLKAALKRPALTAVVSVLPPFLGFLVAPSLHEQFFPAADRDHFHVSLRLDPGASTVETANVSEQARQIIEQFDEVTSVALFVGSNAPMLHYSMLAMDEGRSNFAQGIVQTKLRRVGPEFIRAVQTRLEQTIPQAQVNVTWIEQGPATIAPIEFRIYGPNLEELASLGDEARRILTTIPGVAQTRASLENGGRTLGIRVQQHEATGAALTDHMSAEQLSAELEGLVATTLSEQMEEIPIRVQVAGGNSLNPEKVLSLPLLADKHHSNVPVPLGSVAEWSLEPQTTLISRRNGSRCNVVYGYVVAGVLPIEVEKQFEAALIKAGWRLPAGYRTDFGGVSSERNSAVGHLAAYTSILLVCMVTILVVTFHSFRLAAVIGLVAFLSVGLGLLSLRGFGYPIGLVAIIGILGMMGIAINDSIMVLDEIRQAWKRRRSLDDLVDVVVLATRHVVATTITAGVGVLPLIIAGGDFWPPLAIVIAGGVGGATLLALGFTPACFLLLQSRSSAA